MVPDERLISEQFPRSSKYRPEWVLANASGGANSLWLTEWLASALDLRPGMRVLDLLWAGMFLNSPSAGDRDAGLAA
jgi:hypothetical protein